MRKIVCFVASVSAISAAAACSVPPAAVEVQLSNASFGTSGGNLFNCGTPSGPSNSNSVSTSRIGCEPQQNADGTFSTTPVVVTQQVGCGDGHGAVVIVTCAGTGASRNVTGTVTLAITSACDEKTPDATDPQTFAFQDVAPGETQSASGTLDSCAVFDNLCGTSDPCAFNRFAADISVLNVSK